MKGISAVIATILMLMITIALAGAAYFYISSVFTTQIQGIEIVDTTCTPGVGAGNVSVTLRNIGTQDITTSSITIDQLAPAGDSASVSWSGGATTIGSGKIATFTESCSGTGGRNCIYRITPPLGRSVQAAVFCS